ncbi:hypothetical protein BLNAU_13894 [Blattamonas nauphoetae]|uniref:Uncharacterized protein n=1 Tax=Blattamonas nauphoetae TaxID=2049346 RepID=A0ABQ9XFB3_9EUKA|nr:hypothetical protein BLNAU_13894 [Blattamonas nauphoetae]
MGDLPYKIILKGKENTLTINHPNTKKIFKEGLYSYLKNPADNEEYFLSQGKFWPTHPSPETRLQVLTLKSRPDEYLRRLEEAKKKGYEINPNRDNEEDKLPEAPAEVVEEKKATPAVKEEKPTTLRSRQPEKKVMKVVKAVAAEEEDDSSEWSGDDDPDRAPATDPAPVLSSLFVGGVFDAEPLAGSRHSAMGKRKAAKEGMEPKPRVTDMKAFSILTLLPEVADMDTVDALSVSQTYGDAIFAQEAQNPKPLFFPEVYLPLFSLK